MQDALTSFSQLGSPRKAAVRTHIYVVHIHTLVHTSRTHKQEQRDMHTIHQLCMQVHTHTKRDCLQSDQPEHHKHARS